MLVPQLTTLSPLHVFDSRNHHARQAVRRSSHFTDGEDKTEAEVRVRPRSHLGPRVLPTGHDYTSLALCLKQLKYILL